MIKITLEDFLEEVKSEIIGYEEMGDVKYENWEKKFFEKLKAGSLDKKVFVTQGGRVQVKFRDEAEIFSLVDGYLAAVESGREDKFWESL